MSYLEILLCIGLVLCSAFLSSSEIALFSLSRFEQRTIRDTHKEAYRLIKKLLSDPGGLLITVLIGNELVNISLAAITTGLVTQIISEEHRPSWASDWPLWLLHTFWGILITTPIVLLFCEITPKAVATRANQVVARTFVYPLYYLYIAFSPFRWVLRTLGSTSKKGGYFGSAKEEAPVVRESEFLTLVEEGHRTGAIHETEVDLIKNVIELDSTEAIEVATPLARINTLPQTATLGQALQSRLKTQQIRIPITGKSTNQIVGILHTKDLLRAKLNPDMQSLPVSTVMRKPYFIPPNIPIQTVFRRMKANQLHVAVVTNPSDEALAILSMDDILDELFDDLLEEETTGE